MKYIVKVNNLYLKYSNTARAWGGKLYLTDNINEAKLFSHIRWAKYQVYSILVHEKDLKKYGIFNKPEIKIEEREV